MNAAEAAVDRAEIDHIAANLPHLIHAVVGSIDMEDGGRGLARVALSMAENFVLMLASSLSAEAEGESLDQLNLIEVLLLAIPRDTDVPAWRVAAADSARKAVLDLQRLIDRRDEPSMAEVENAQRWIAVDGMMVPPGQEWRAALQAQLAKVRAMVDDAVWRLEFSETDDQSHAEEMMAAIIDEIDKRESEVRTAPAIDLQQMLVFRLRSMLAATAALPCEMPLLEAALAMADQRLDEAYDITETERVRESAAAVEAQKQNERAARRQRIEAGPEGQDKNVRHHDNVLFRFDCLDEDLAAIEESVEGDDVVAAFARIQLFSAQGREKAEQHRHGEASESLGYILVTLRTLLPTMAVEHPAYGALYAMADDLQRMEYFLTDEEKAAMPPLPPAPQKVSTDAESAAVSTSPADAEH